MVKRREFLYGLGVAIGGSMLLGPNLSAHADAGWSDRLVQKFAELEKERGGRLGVAVTDTLSGNSAAHRGDERFPMCSTFKALAVAALLARVDAGKEQIDRRVRFEAKDIVANSPVSKNHVGSEGMSLADVCEAAITFSDNTAGNLLLANLGGPEGLTAYARSLGDTVTRLDRNEPDLNEALSGDPRDTTSPAAMLSDFRALVSGNALMPASRDRLIGWLVGNKTGDARLRAGFPRDWRIGDKTGSGEKGTTNDVAVVWPAANRPPLFVAVYLTESSPEAEHRNATLAAVARLVAASL
ncbi:MAG TPA: class A beta-lactamase [Bradyrhizobium sp.]|uniref:class A beta-lactamase n=1 Tax=Bradyrhizobium sp. TaxID=376 RepID=UPI002D7F4A8C|nr:class A beta-lactamase [Bradyrhizobium sp.]HET7889645.1 class A beta-lactamase [Bradyrhizobium sp.]